MKERLMGLFSSLLTNIFFYRLFYFFYRSRVGDPVRLPLRTDDFNQVPEDQRAGLKGYDEATSDSDTDIVEKKAVKEKKVLGMSQGCDQQMPFGHRIAVCKGGDRSEGVNGFPILDPAAEQAMVITVLGRIGVGRFGNNRHLDGHP